MPAATGFSSMGSANPTIHFSGLPYDPTKIDTATYLFD
jgi:hypothetical protein